MSGAKTEEPTPRREAKARREGRAWQSRDLALGATLAALGALLNVGGDALGPRFSALFARSMTDAARGDFAPGRAIDAAMREGADIAIPCLAALVLVGASVSALQVRGLFALGALAPDASRLDPGARFGASGPRVLASFVTSLARLALVLSVSIATIVEAMPGVATLSRRATSASIAAAWTVSSALALRVGLALIAFGVADALIERALFRRSLRMSRRDVERERREAEGDAHLKRERERVRDELARAGALDDVSAARLLVVDDALAIALSYDEADLDAVPRVASIGRGDQADALVRDAQAAGVPSVRDADLAAALAIVPAGTDVPEALYERVAIALTLGERRQ